jgi:hypothetical protein
MKELLYMIDCDENHNAREDLVTDQAVQYMGPNVSIACGFSEQSLSQFALYP